MALLCELALAMQAYGEQITLDMSSLEHWKPVTFPWVSRHSTYTAERLNGQSMIHIQSDNSSSGLEYRRVFSTYDTPVLEWSWKAMNLLAKGNAETKSGDDYAVRIEIMFPYDQTILTSLQQLRYEFLKNLLGSYPPSAILNYVWANRPHARNPIRNAYSGEGEMFFTDSGSAHLGSWRSHRVDIVADYRRAFKRDPPGSFTLAIMGDSDDTHGKTDAYIREIRLSSYTQMNPSR